MIAKILILYDYWLRGISFVGFGKNNHHDGAGIWKKTERKNSRKNASG